MMSIKTSKWHRFVHLFIGIVSHSIPISIPNTNTGAINARPRDRLAISAWQNTWLVNTEMPLCPNKNRIACTLTL